MKRYGNRHHGCRVEEFGWRNQQLIVMENELLRIGIVASKGADLVEFRYKPLDLDVLWHAPQNLYPGEYVPTVSRPQGAFLDYFPGGWQEVFPNAGPGTVLEGAALGQHGEVALLPWDVEVRCDSAERVEIEFHVETMRTPFSLRRRMVLESNSPVLQMHEQITNLGKQALPFAWGHHPAFGPPFLQEGCVIDMPPCEVEQSAYSEGLARRFALQEAAAFPELLDTAGIKRPMNVVPSPDARTEDVLTCSSLTDGWCALRNPALGLAVGLLWDRNVFPYLWMWQVYGGSIGYPYFGRTFNLALEPFTCPVIPLAEAAARKLAPVIGPGESLETRLECGIHKIDEPIRSMGGAGRVDA